MEPERRFTITAVALLVAAISLVGCTQNSSIKTDASEESRFEVVDGVGRRVSLPREIERVVTISDGLVEGVMTALGVQDRLVGLGSSCLVREFDYTFETSDGGAFTYRGGMNPVRFLNPWIADLPLVVRSGAGTNFEALAGLEPDVVIIRAGDCSISSDGDTLDKTLATLDSLGIPAVVLLATHLRGDPFISDISEEIRIVGSVFDREGDAAALAAGLEQSCEEFRARIAEAKPDPPPSVLLLGLSPNSRKQGGAGNVMGSDTIENYFLEDVLGARNAFEGGGYFRIVSAEHLLALDPEVIILHTSSGYHPALELHEAPYYEMLRGMRAVRERRVAALPWSPCNCDKRLEYPIDVAVMAKTIYPELFSDVDLGAWLLDFYRKVYGVDERTAEGLKSAQWMDWVDER